MEQVSVARTVLGVVVLCNYPLQMFPSRVSTLSLVAACIKTAGADYAAMPVPPAVDAPGLFITDPHEVMFRLAHALGCRMLPPHFLFTCQLIYFFALAS